MSLGINSSMTQEEQEKALAQFQQNVVNFQAEMQAMMRKYSVLIPTDVIFLQLSFWSAVQMKALIESSTLPGNDATIN